MSKAGDLKAKYEAQRVARANKYGSEIQGLYYDAIDAAALAADSVKLQEGVFKLSKYPALNSKVNKILNQLSGKIELAIVRNVVTEWIQADFDSDSLFNTLLKRGGKKSALLNMRNDDALAAFQKRVDGKGLNLSKRIFKYTGAYKQELEAGLADGIYYGKSARDMARDLKGFLSDPDKLFRRIKKDGVLKLSKPALDYKPGTGVYRSSFKNVLRVTSNETNLAYRRSDSERYANTPFITGIQVRLSNNHPSFDLCDQLQGQYPKTFIFTGWHVNCRCYQVPLMLSPSQYENYENDLLAGKNPNAMDYTDRDLPTGDHAKEWFSNNSERINNWSSTPYFISNNESFFKK